MISKKGEKNWGNFIFCYHRFSGPDEHVFGTHTWCVFDRSHRLYGNGGSGFIVNNKVLNLFKKVNSK